jgi:hypothetical protein
LSLCFFVSYNFRLHTDTHTTPGPMARSFMHVQMCVYGLSCCIFGHDINTVCYHYYTLYVLPLRREKSVLGQGDSGWPPAQWFNLGMIQVLDRLKQEYSGKPLRWPVLRLILASVITCAGITTSIFVWSEYASLIASQESTAILKWAEKNLVVNATRTDN